MPNFQMRQPGMVKRGGPGAGGQVGQGSGGGGLPATAIVTESGVGIVSESGVQLVKE